MVPETEPSFFCAVGVLLRRMVSFCGGCSIFIISPRPVEGANGLHRPRFSGKSVAVGILKVPSGAKIQQNRGRWTYLLPSTGRGYQECPASAAWMSPASVSSRCIAAADVLLLTDALLLAGVSFRGSWRGQMASTGRDFPAKVWPSAF